MLADLVAFGDNHAYVVIAGVAVLVAALIWRHTR
jgi:hypothetical protein